MADFSKIPAELKERRQWVCFNTKKEPINPMTGGKAMPNNLATCGSYNDAVSYRNKHLGNGIAGIGYVFSADDAYTGVDLDKFRYEDGSFKLCAQFLIEDFASYAEVSPSGTGAHILIKANLPKDAGHQRNLPCKTKLETYDTFRYFTMTGNHIPWTPHSIESRQAELDTFYQLYIAKPKPNTSTTHGKPLGMADSELLDKARRSENGHKFIAIYDNGDTSAYGGDDSSADLALCHLLAFWTGNDYSRIERLFNSSALGQRDKWQRRTDYRQRTIEKAISQTTEVYDPGKLKHNGLNRQTQPADEPPPIEWPENEADGERPASERSCERTLNNDSFFSSTRDVSSIDDKIRTGGIFSEAEITYLCELIKVKESQRGVRNIAAEIREWVLSSHGVFMSADVDKELHLSSMSSNQEEKRNIQKHLSKTLERLVTDSLIERYGNKRGCFRRIEKDCNAIDFLSAPTQPLKILWPFNLERLVTIYPKNIVIVAGAPNAGKTALLLNTIRMNMNTMPVIYFSSEMGESELRLRLEKFAYPLTSWNFQAKERAANFQDVIEPDAMNIIDFLEISDKFYEVGEQIRKIYDRLEKGIAVIALQKKVGANLGRGAEFSLEKARLYLSIDNHVLKIVKAKNYVQSEINPNGREYGFKLASGCKFTNITEK